MLRAWSNVFARQGLKLERVKIKADEYFAWLSDAENAEEKRQEFALLMFQLQDDTLEPVTEFS